MVKTIEDIILIGAMCILGWITGYGIARGSAAVETWREQDDERTGADTAEGD